MLTDRAIPDTVVPFVSLASTTAAVRDVFLAELEKILDSGEFTNAPVVAEFERALAAYCGANDCVALASGLDALRLALLAIGIEPGDEVIVPANTFVATFEAISQAGGTPVPVDVTEDDYNLDVDAVAAAVSPRTRFLMPVHLYGQMADMKAVAALAQSNALSVIEDACQAHGAFRDGLQAGAAGTAGAFSFYPSKNLGAFGDGGALVVAEDNSEVAARVRILREHGQRERYRHVVEGFTSRLDTIQAIVLRHKLPLLDVWNEQRTAVARFYDRELEGVGDLRLPSVAPGSSPVWHLYVVRTEDPLALGTFLRDHGIGTGRHYPEPPHLSGAYAFLGHQRGEFPVTEMLAHELLSLPVFPGMTPEQLTAVVEAIARYFKHG